MLTAHSAAATDSRLRSKTHPLTVAAALPAAVPFKNCRRHACHYSFSAVIVSHRFAIAFIALAALAGRSAAAAQAYIIVDSQTGYVLQESKSKDKRQVGSLTKIATAAVVLDWAEKKGGDLNQVVSIPPQAFVGAGENNVGFQPRDETTLRDLLYAALVQSDNIAA